MIKGIMILNVFLMFINMMFFTACVPGAAEKIIAADIITIGEKQGERQKTVITALLPEKEQPEEPPAPAPRLVLEQGNYWTAGIPGFGENALSAISGEYRIPGKTAFARVWLTREFVYYDRWARRVSISSHTVLQKAEDIGRIASSALDETWTLVVLLPGGSELSLEEEDRLITIFLSRLSGFSNQAISNISLPAMIPY